MAEFIVCALSPLVKIFLFFIFFELIFVYILFNILLLFRLVNFCLFCSFESLCLHNYSFMFVCLFLLSPYCLLKCINTLH